MASAVAQADMGVWMLCLQLGSRHKAPGRGVRGRSPPEAGDILQLKVHIREGFCDPFCKSLHNRLVSYAIYNY